MAPFVYAAALLAITLLKPTIAISPGFDYGSTKVRGVNLGGWLVLYAIYSSRFWIFI